jgi:hypothetical protein
MKKLILIIAILTAFTIAGCTTTNQSELPQVTNETTSSIEINNEMFSLNYPSSFTQTEDNNGIITISDSLGKIMIGDFEPNGGPTPSEGMTQQQTDELPKDIVYHGYEGKFASALFYKTGDTETMQQLLKIQSSIEIK